jgi:hypothetical protein
MGAVVWERRDHFTCFICGYLLAVNYEILMGGIVESNTVHVTDLNTVIAIRISQQLLQTSAIQKLFYEKLPCAMLCNANALHGRVSEHHDAPSQ